MQLASTVVFADMLIRQFAFYPNPQQVHGLPAFSHPPVNKGSFASPPGTKHNDSGLPALPHTPLSVLQKLWSGLAELGLRELAGHLQAGGPGLRKGELRSKRQYFAVSSMLLLNTF